MQRCRTRVLDESLFTVLLPQGQGRVVNCKCQRIGCSHQRLLGVFGVLDDAVFALSYATPWEMEEP